MERHTGRILQATVVEAGSISDFATVLVTSGGRYFCKGATASNPMGWMHRNEARINPHLPAQVPRLQWQVEVDGWLLLGFEYVEGRHPDLSPGPPDLPAMAATLSTMAAALTPCPVPRVQAAAVRWADRIAPEVIDGDTLVHTDVTPNNFLVHASGVTVVDWAMPCRGVAWIDTVLMVVWLIRAEHSPAEAEAWAERIPVWSTARPRAVDDFAAGIAGLSRARHRQRPMRPISPSRCSRGKLDPLSQRREATRRGASCVRHPGGAAAGNATRGTGARTVAATFSKGKSTRRSVSARRADGNRGRQCLTADSDPRPPCSCGGHRNCCSGRSRRLDC